MRALIWHGKHDVRIETVDDPGIVNPRDAIIRVTSSAICGLDLHIYDGLVPAMHAGDILGHEFMGEVVETGPASTLRRGQRVVVPFTIACGSCYHCLRLQYSACENSNPAKKQDIAMAAYGQPMGALFGCGHGAGGYSGGQAEYVRVPFSDVGPIEVPEGIEDEQMLFLANTLPSGWQAAEQARILDGDTVAVWGCGAVGLFAVQAAFALGAGRVIAIDRLPRRLELARGLGAQALDFDQTDIHQALLEMTGGLGPDACIDAVGLEAQGAFLDTVVDEVKASIFSGHDRALAVRQAIMACRKGGRIVVPGLYGGLVDQFPMGALMQKGLTLRTGRTDVQRYAASLMQAVLDGLVDTTFLISHRLDLEQAPHAYRQFRHARNDVVKVVLKPGWRRQNSSEKEGDGK